MILLLKRPFPVLSKRKRQLLNFNLNFRLISLLLPYISEIVPIYWKSVKNGLMDDYMEYLTIRGITWTESSKGNVPIHVILSGIQLKLGRIATLLTTQLLHYKLLFFFNYRNESYGEKKNNSVSISLYNLNSVKHWQKIDIKFYFLNRVLAILPMKIKFGHGPSYMFLAVWKQTNNRG